MHFNKSKKIIFLLFFISTSSHSKEQFEGFYTQIGSGTERNSVEELNATSVSTFNNGSTQADNLYLGKKYFKGAPIHGALGFNVRVSPKWIMGVGAEYSHLAKKSQGETIVGSNTGNFIPNVQVGIQGRYNVFMTSGLVIDKNKLLYIKAGYSRQKLVLTEPGNTSGFQRDPAVSVSDHINGYILGLGYRQMLTDNFYGFAEANYMKYRKADLNFSTVATDGTYTTQTSGINPKTSAYNLLVGLGYEY